MKLAIALLLTSHAAATFAGPPANTVKATAINVVEYRYVGLTQGETDGRVTTVGRSGENLAGVAAMHRLCAKEFGKEARAANIQEAYFRNDTDLRSAWLAPSSAAMQIVEVAPSQFAAVDSATGLILGNSGESEFSAIQGAYCLQYVRGANSPYAAPTSARDGLVDLSSCDNVLPVACSIPTRIRAKRLKKIVDGS